jgi:hypothetical protein
MPSARIAVEARARTHWWVKQLEGFGHQVLVANTREFAQSQTGHKNDSNDAERLAHYAQFDPEALSVALLSPEPASVLPLVLTAIDDLTQKIEDQDNSPACSIRKHNTCAR